MVIFQTLFSSSRQLKAENTRFISTRRKFEFEINYTSITQLALSLNDHRL